MGWVLDSTRSYRYAAGNTGGDCCGMKVDPGVGWGLAYCASTNGDSYKVDYWHLIELMAEELFWNVNK